MSRALSSLTFLLCCSCTPSTPPAGDCTAEESQRGPFCEGTAIIQCLALTYRQDTSFRYQTLTDCSATQARCEHGRCVPAPPGMDLPRSSDATPPRTEGGLVLDLTPQADWPLEIPLSCKGIHSCLERWCFGGPYYLADPSCRNTCRAKGTTHAQNLFAAWQTCVQMKAVSDCPSACFNLRWPEKGCIACIDKACQAERALCDQHRS